MILRRRSIDVDASARHNRNNSLLTQISDLVATLTLNLTSNLVVVVQAVQKIWGPKFFTYDLVATLTFKRLQCIDTPLRLQGGPHIVSFIVAVYHIVCGLH